MTIRKTALGNGAVLVANLYLLNYSYDSYILTHISVGCQYVLHWAKHAGCFDKLPEVSYAQMSKKRNEMAKHRSWHSADIKRARKKKLKAAKRKAQKNV